MVYSMYRGHRFFQKATYDGIAQAQALAREVALALACLRSWKQLGLFAFFFFAKKGDCPFDLLVSNLVHV